MRLNDIYDLTSTNILNYYNGSTNISMMDNILVGRTPIRYNTHQNRLYLDMETSNISADEFIIVECYRKIDPTDMTDIYNDMWLKEICNCIS